MRRHCRGAAYLYRYADDFLERLGKRMEEFHLELAPEKTRPHSTGFSGDAPILSQYACYFNRLPARCLIRTNRHPMGDETWHRPPTHLAKTAPSPSISTMRPPTRSSLATPRRSSSLSWPSSSPSASS